MFLILGIHPFWNINASVEARKMKLDGIGGGLPRTALRRLTTV